MKITNFLFPFTLRPLRIFSSSTSLISHKRIKQKIYLKMFLWDGGNLVPIIMRLSLKIIVTLFQSTSTTYLSFLTQYAVELLVWLETKLLPTQKVFESSYWIDGISFNGEEVFYPICASDWTQILLEKEIGVIVYYPNYVSFLFIKLCWFSIRKGTCWLMNIFHSMHSFLSLYNCQVVS